MFEIKLVAFIFCSVVVFIYVETVKAGRSDLKLAFDVYFPPTEKYLDLPPIILIHGLFDSKATWKYIAPIMANATDRKIYTFDLRNHGESPWVDEINFDLVADDLNDFMNQHEIPKAVLVGHSMGGRCAITFTLRQPERVEKLIVEDFVVENIRFIPQGVSSLGMKLLRRSLLVIPPGTDGKTAQKIFTEFIRKRVPDEFFPCQMNFDLLPIKVIGGRYTWKTNIDAIEKSVMAGNGVTFEQDFSSFKTYSGDALFLYASKSVFNVEKDELIFKYFPRAIKLRFEGATHMIHHEFQEDFIREIAHFINGRIKLKKTICEKA